jgi:hypothetical protein
VVIPAVLLVAEVEDIDRSCGWRGPVLTLMEAKLLVLLLLVGCLGSILECLEMGGVDVGEGIDPSPGSWHPLGPLLLSMFGCGNTLEENVKGSSDAGEDIEPSSATSRITPGWKLIRNGIRLNCAKWENGTSVSVNELW